VSEDTSTDETRQAPPQPLSEDEAQAAIAQIVDGKLHTTYRGAPVVFHPVTLREANRLTRLHREEMVRLTSEGKLLNESMVAAVVAKRAEALGFDKRAADPSTYANYLKRIFAVVPDASGPNGAEALAAAQEQLAKEFSAEDAALIEQASAVATMRASLGLCTVEKQAAALRLQHEILWAVRTPDGAPFWASMEALEDEPNELLKPLADEYRRWRSGSDHDFLSA
jgi:hypothetical protein